MAQAQQDFLAIPGVESLLNHSKANVRSGNTLRRLNGQTSSISSRTFSDGQYEYLVPTIYDGRQVSDDEAWSRAQQQMANGVVFPTAPAGQHGQLDALSEQISAHLGTLDLNNTTKAKGLKRKQKNLFDADDASFMDMVKGVSTVTNAFIQDKVGDYGALAGNAMTMGTALVGQTGGALMGLATMSAPQRDSSGAYIEGTGRGLDHVAQSIEAGGEKMAFMPNEDDPLYDKQMNNLATAGTAMERLAEKLLPYREAYERKAAEMGIPMEVAAAIWTLGIVGAETISPSKFVPKGALVRFAKEAQVFKARMAKDTGIDIDALGPIFDNVKSTPKPDVQAADVPRLPAPEGLPEFKTDVADNALAGKVTAYHGTRAEPFDKFETQGNANQRVQGAYFTKTEKSAEKWAGLTSPTAKQGRVIQSEIDLKNPAGREVLDEIGYGLRGDEMREELIRRGYDGVIDDSMDEIIAFYPEQITQKPSSNALKSPGDKERGSIKVTDDDTKGLNALETTATRSAATTTKKKTKKKRQPALGTLFDEIYDYNTAQKMAERGKHLRRDKTGKYTGSPDVTSPQELGALRKKIDKLVDEGSFNMDWYERARKTAVRFYPNDPAMQELFARGAAAYSPQADPGNELLAFLTQHNTRMLTGETVQPRTGAQSRNVDRAYRNAPDEVNPESIKLGPKTGPYGDAKNPVIPEADLYKTANDIWHGRVMGYGEDFDRGFTATEHNYLTGENILLAQRAEARDAASGTTRSTQWSPRAGQAATWGAKRKEKFIDKELAKVEKKNKELRSAKPPKSYKTEEAIAKWQTRQDAKIVDTKDAEYVADLDARAEAYARFGIDDAAARHSAYQTSEARTGESVNHLKMDDSETDLIASYTDLVRDQAMKRQSMADDLKLYSADAVETSGYYTNSAGEVELNPGYAHPILVSSDVKGTPKVRDADRAFLDYVTQVDATLTGQEAGAWSKFFPQGMGKQKVGDMNAVMVEHGPMTEKTFKQLQDIAEKADAQIVNYGDVTMFVRFGDAGPIPGTTKQIKVAVAAAGTDWKAAPGTLDSGYQPTGLGRGHPRTNAFKPDQHEATNALLDAADQAEQTVPNIAGRTADAVSAKAKAMNEIDAAVAKASGKAQREDLVKLRGILADGGIPALRDYVRKYGKAGLPAVLLALLSSQNQNSLVEET